MHNRLDLTGQRFGRLVVQQRGPTRNQRVHWLCRCDCGATTIVRAWALTAGRTVSCGCYGKAQRRAARQVPQALIDRVAALHQARYQRQEIAARLYISPSTVTRLLKRAGLRGHASPMRPRLNSAHLAAAYDDLGSFAAVARAVGYHRTTVARRLKRYWAKTNRRAA